jgi:hypothetical protein
MLYRILADAVVVVHLGFIMFVATGALLAWRWPALVWLHLPALAWGVGTIAIGFPCPLTSLEKGLLGLAGTGGYGGGFVDRYIEDVVYPDEYSLVLWTVAAVAILGGYVGRLTAQPGSALRPPGGRGSRSAASHVPRCPGTTAKTTAAPTGMRRDPSAIAVQWKNSSRPSAARTVP